MSEPSGVGAIVWTDLTVRDAEGTRDFYAAVAGWRFEPVEMGGYADFNMLAPGRDEPVAGVCHARGPNAGLPPQWLVSIAVADLDTSTKACVERGGVVIDGPRLVGRKRFCVIRDPAGAHAGLIEA